MQHERSPDRNGRRRGSRATLLLTLWMALPTGAACAAEHARTLWLVRHGQYDQAGRSMDESTGKLVPIGQAQVRLLAARLRELGVAFDAFDASPLPRARETAAILDEELPGPGVRIVAELAECTPPTRRADAVADEPPATMAACSQRLDELFKSRFVPAPDRDRNELLVGHGNVIRYLVTRALGVDPRAWLEMSVHNASLTVIRVEPDGRFKVLAVGDCGYLPPSMLTGATGDPERALAPSGP
jgi:serine/threonine-protein phosphatase PGAM5